jgi:hypothetical protein
MKISKHRLAQIIREEKRKLLYEADKSEEEEEEAETTRLGVGTKIRQTVAQTKGITPAEFPVFSAAIAGLISGFDQKAITKDPALVQPAMERFWKALGVAGVDLSAVTTAAQEAQKDTEKGDDEGPLPESQQVNASKKLAKRLLRNRKRRR